MSKFLPNEKGIAHLILVIIILVICLAAGVFLITQKTQLFPQASDEPKAAASGSAVTYENPFTSPAPYTNPFTEESTYENPFNDL